MMSEPAVMPNIAMLMAERTRVSRIWSISAHMQIRNSPARNARFLVIRRDSHPRLVYFLVPSRHEFAGPLQYPGHLTRGYGWGDAVAERKQGRADRLERAL